MSQYELGDIYLSGSTHELHHTLGGSGSLYAQDFPLQHAYLQTNVDSDGNIHVRPARLLAGTHAGTGTVFYSAPRPDPPARHGPGQGAGRIKLFTVSCPDAKPFQLANFADRCCRAALHGYRHGTLRRRTGFPVVGGADAGDFCPEPAIQTPALGREPWNC